MVVGRGGVRGGPWKLLSKKGCFFNFEGQRLNFTTFGAPWKTFWENPLLPPPWKKSFRSPCVKTLLKFIYQNRLIRYLSKKSYLLRAFEIGYNDFDRMVTWPIATFFRRWFCSFFKTSARSFTVSRFISAVCGAAGR